MRLWSKAQQKVLTFEVSSGTWTQRLSQNATITNDVGFTMFDHVRGKLATYVEDDVPAGQVGLWCSHGSANEFDNAAR
ncbi:hypothetical protein RAS1_42630 [Phycisphaerae bacterium RAS1]|nr:hypothetical protein RAS1_42630 [Phycisphaerae bacterium RAS1]